MDLCSQWRSTEPSEELNRIVDLAHGEEGCFGARMTGGGFGGCAVALVDTSTAPSFATAVGAAYHLATGIMPSAYICEATNGAEVVLGI